MVFLSRPFSRLLFFVGRSSLMSFRAIGGKSSLPIACFAYFHAYPELQQDVSFEFRLKSEELWTQ